MSGFTVRDARLAAIARARGRTADAELQERLTDLAARWAPEDWTTADETVERGALQLIWQHADVDRLVADDAVARALRAAPALSDEELAALAVIGRYPRPLLGQLRAEVLHALGGKEARFARLVPVVHEQWLGMDAASRPYPWDDVAMLLPLALETVFLEPDDQVSEWRMMVRVVPQPPSIDLHTETVDPGEDEAATRFWQRIGSTARLTSARLGEPGPTAAFTELATAVGAARAAWLVTATRPVRRDGVLVAERGPASVGADDSGDPRVVGLPPRLNVEIWTYAADGREVVTSIGSLPDEDQPEAATIAPDIPLPMLERRHVPSDPENPAAALPDHSPSWLLDWDEARRLGLGGLFRLPAGIGPAELGGVCVSGVGDVPASELMRHHVLSGVLARVSLGAHTNSVSGADSALTRRSRDGSPAIDGAPTVLDWRDAAGRRLDALRPSSVATTTDTDRVVARHLAGVTAEDLSVPSLAVPAGLDDRDRAEAALDEAVPATGLSRLLLRALWPTLWGTWLNDAWPVGDAGVHFAAWANAHVSPEGPLPPVRFGAHPYGLLPVTDLRAWQPDPGYPEPGRRMTTTLRDALVSALDELHARNRPGGTVRDADEDAYAGLLGRGGSSREFRWRHMLADPHWSWLNGSADATPLRDDFARATAELHLPYDPQHPVPVDVLTSQRNGLPLVRPGRSAYARREDATMRLPLRYLVDLALRRTQYLQTADAPPVHLAELFRRTDMRFVEPEWDHGNVRVGLLPDSLLVRLLVQACLVANGWRNGMAPGDRDSFLDLVWPVEQLPPGQSPNPNPEEYDVWRDDRQSRDAVRVAELVDPHRVEEVDGVGWGRTSVQFPSLPVDTDSASEGRVARMERALGAVLDAASVRVDPWITAFAWERLGWSEGSAERRQRLGAYGWAFGPFDGAPGPTPSGLLHTPSGDQTTMATILRDNHREAARRGIRNESGELLWQMDVTSDATRLATEVAEDVRQGLHLYDVLGRAVEDVLAADAAPGAPSAYQRIGALRVDYPMYDDARDPRQVCHGLHALTGDPDDPARPGLIDHTGRGADPRHPLTAIQEQRLARIVRALDVLSDATLMEGVVQSLGRAVGRASAAMDAASGLGVMPTFEGVQTRPSGFVAETTVLSLLPAREAAADAEAASLAEPSVAAFLAERLGAAWLWTAHLEDGTTRTVTLDALHLSPVDTLAWGPDQLRALAAWAMGLREVTIAEVANRTWLVREPGEPDATVALADLGAPAAGLADLDVDAVQDLVVAHRFGGVPHPAAEASPVPSADPRAWVVRDALGGVVGVYDLQTLGVGGEDAVALRTAIRARAGAPALADLEDPRSPGLVDPPEAAACRRLAALLGVPATARHLARPGEVADVSAAFEELRRRYTAAHADLTAAWRDASAAGRLGVAGAGAQRAAIRRAARWGFTPDAAAPDAVAFRLAMTSDADTRPPEGATSFRDLARQAAAVLRARLEAAPRPAGARGLPSPKAVRGPMPDHAERRAAGIPDGVPALAAALSALVSPQGALPVLATWARDDLLAATGLDPAPAADVDGEWLTLAAAVRPPLQRVEAVQLGSEPLTAWTNSDDPWLREDIARNAARRVSDDLAALAVPRLFVGYGPDDALAGTRVVAGVVDAYSETVPMSQRDTHAAFGFNAPAARAPQAILLAVPPVPRTLLDERTLSGILSQTRALLVARTTTVGTLGRLDRVMRATFVEYTPGFVADPAFPI